MTMSFPLADILAIFPIKHSSKTHWVLELEPGIGETNGWTMSSGSKVQRIACACTFSGPNYSCTLLPYPLNLPNNPAGRFCWSYRNKLNRGSSEAEPGGSGEWQGIHRTRSGPHLHLPLFKPQSAKIHGVPMWEQYWDPLALPGGEKSECLPVIFLSPLSWLPALPFFYSFQKRLVHK